MGLEGSGYVIPLVPRGGGFVLHARKDGVRTLLSADFHTPRTQELPTTAEALADALGGSS